MMDAIDMLAAQHRALDALFEEFSATDGARERLEIFDDIADMVVVHTTIEENHFYPAIKVRRSPDVLLEALLDHRSIKQILNDMLAAAQDPETDPGEFAPRLALLREEIDHHVREEESNLFPKARAILDKPELDQLAQEMTVAQEELLERGSPRAMILQEGDVGSLL